MSLHTALSYGNNLSLFSAGHKRRNDGTNRFRKTYVDSGAYRASDRTEKNNTNNKAIL